MQCEVEEGRGRGDCEEVTREGSASCSFGLVCLVAQDVPQPISGGVTQLILLCCRPPAPPQTLQQLKKPERELHVQCRPLSAPVQRSPRLSSQLLMCM